jgi:6-pyruvoyltetrahydropterin/6-carboxytetrahydropterin synthase
VAVWFDGQCLTFLERDVLLLPIRNVTIEELSALLLARLRGRPELTDPSIHAIALAVSSGSGQWAWSVWESA